MAQLSRVTQKIFCSTGSQQTAVFGTMKSGSPTYSTNIATLMGNTAWNSGWSGAIIAGKAPFMEEFNAIERVNTQQIAYILQSGIPEWDSGTDYYAGDIVKVVSSGVITVWGATASSTNQNPTSTSGYWAKYFDSTVPYLTQGLVSNCITSIPQDIKLEYTGTTITLKAGSIITTPDGSQLQLSSDSVWTSSLTGTHECLLFPRDTGVGLYYQYPSSITSGSTDPKAGETYHIWFDTANKVINRYTSNASTPSQTLALPVCKFTVTSGVITSVDTVFNGFGWCGNALFRLPNVKFLIPDGRNSNGTLKSRIIQRNTLYINNISYSITSAVLACSLYSTGFTAFNKSEYFEQDTAPTIGANFERWYNTKENKCYYHAAGGTEWIDATGTNAAWAICGTVSKDGVEYTSFNVYDPIRLASTDQVKSLESKVFNDDSSVGGNHTFTGTNTFSGYTLFTNPYGINITAGTCTNTPVAADYSQAIANTMFVQNCISQHEVAPAITVLWGDGTPVGSPTNFSLSESFLNFEKIGVELAADNEDARTVSIKETYWLNRLLQANTNKSVLLSQDITIQISINTYNHTTNPSTSTNLKVAYENHAVIYYIYGINRKKVP